jgi:thymidylate synthase (FAD)
MTTSSEIRFRSDFTVALTDWMGNDLAIVNAARVTAPDDWAAHEFGRDACPQCEKDRGLLNMLMRDRHGTPWEHVVFTFYIEAPIFVAREAHRHRIASINEESGRYKELKPVFYLPVDDRPLIQEGKPGAYTFKPGGLWEMATVSDVTRESSARAYAAYREMLDTGIAREVARMVLPVNIYTSWYLTINLRSLFNFLSLRNKTDETTVPTFPMWEIQWVANQMEALAATVVPESMKLFNENGRLSP